MQQIFLHCFEQYTEQTQLLVLCGPKGNGKTLRLERAAASFVPGWVTMSGPRSAKAGMQGNNDSINGCNAVYDEMIDDLRENGGNQIEYMKQILLEPQVRLRQGDAAEERGRARVARDVED